jgi:hypothetical protein
MVVCRYCALESAVSHASERECIDELKREVARLKDHLLHGQPGGLGVVQLALEPVARRVLEPGGSRVWPSSDRGRSDAIVLSLVESNR